MPAIWLLLIPYTLMFNLFHYWFLEENTIFLLLDIALKFIIVFIPYKVHKFLEKAITSLHFEV